jgi:hypothetical protein
MHIIPFNNIVDVGGDGGIGADAMLFHLLNQFALSQVARRRRLPVTKGKRSKAKALSLSKIWQLVLILRMCKDRQKQSVGGEHLPVREKQ